MSKLNVPTPNVVKPATPFNSMSQEMRVALSPTATDEQLRKIMAGNDKEAALKALDRLQARQNLANL